MVVVNRITDLCVTVSQSSLMIVTVSNVTIHQLNNFKMLSCSYCTDNVILDSGDTGQEGFHFFSSAAEDGSTHV